MNIGRCAGAEGFVGQTGQFTWQDFSPPTLQLTVRHASHYSILHPNPTNSFIYCGVRWCRGMFGALRMMLYCSPVWWGFARAQEWETLERLIWNLVRQGFLPPSSTSFETLCSNVDTKLFA